MKHQQRNNVKLPPTGFMLASSLLGIKDEDYSKSLIEEGIDRDYRFGNNVMRSVCSSANLTPRDYGESNFLKTELASIDSIREFAQRFQVPIKSLSVEAQRAINLGYVPEDKRNFHMKELNFEDIEDPLVLFSKRRRSSLESKIGKTLERIARYKQTDVGRKDEHLNSLKDAFTRLERELDYDLLAWRVSRDTPFQMCDVCPTDFAAVTYVVDSSILGKNGEISELQDRNEISSRIDLVKSYASNGRNKITFNEKNNFIEDKRDRAISFYTQNPRTNATFESRIITPRDLIEATIGNRSHDGYKVIQQGKIEELRREDPQFAELVNRSLEFANSTSLNELYLK